MENLFSNPNAVIFFQLLLAILFGGSLGIQRSLSHKTAGMRTFALVSMGACLFVIVSQIVGTGASIGLADFAPLQIPAAIITSIGFLGAGLIIFKDDKISGLTTAAGLWVSAGIGISVGFGLFMVAFLATLFTFVIFTLLWKLEVKIQKITEKNGTGDVI